MNVHIASAYRISPEKDREIRKAKLDTYDSRVYYYQKLKLLEFDYPLRKDWLFLKKNRFFLRIPFLYIKNVEK